MTMEDDDKEGWLRTEHFGTSTKNEENFRSLKSLLTAHRVLNHRHSAFSGAFPHGRGNATKANTASAVRGEAPYLLPKAAWATKLLADERSEAKNL